MLHVPHILAAGMRDWSVKEWGAWYALTSGFITVTVTPFVVMMFSHIKGLQRRAEGAEKSAVVAQVRAAEADTKASAAVASNAKTNDRVNIVALATPYTGLPASLTETVLPAPPPPRPPVPSAPPTVVK